MNKERNIKNDNKKIINKKREDLKCEVGEDATKYGEFVSSYFAWVPLPTQKERAKELDKMTKKKEK